VAVLDAAALTTPLAELAARLYKQFPDLVLVAAGGSGDQQVLAGLIASGAVYRFLHKPVSEQRVKQFTEAAWRRHEESRGGAGTALPGRPARVGGMRWLALALGVVVVLAAAGWLLLHGARVPGSTDESEAPLSVASDATLEALLARANRALDAGALVAPPGENAAELFRAALRHSARDLRAVNGLELIIERLLGEAEAQLRAGDLDGAQRLCDEARRINPEHPHVAFLATQISAQRERALLAQVQRAAAGGDLNGAVALLDGAAQGTKPSMLVNEARHELLAQLIAEGRHQLATGNLERADYWVAAAAAAGADADQVSALKEDLAQARRAPAGDTPTAADTPAPAPEARPASNTVTAGGMQP